MNNNLKLFILSLRVDVLEEVILKNKIMTKKEMEKIFEKKFKESKDSYSGG